MNIGALIALALGSILIDNVVLSKFLGICPFIGVSKKEESALGMGIAVTFVLVVSSSVTWLLYHYVLAPNGIEFMRTIVFILVISSLVQFVEMFLKKMAPAMYKLLGIYLPLITTNCVILGVALLNIDNGFSFVEMIVYSAANAIGFTWVIYIFSTIRERLEYAPIPEAFKGVPIALIVAGIMSMVLMRFVGVI